MSENTIMTAEEFARETAGPYNLRLRLIKERDAQLLASHTDVPPGWKLVPMNMTKEMISAGRQFEGTDVYEHSEIKNIYADIISAAPKYEPCQFCGEHGGHPGFVCSENQTKWAEFYPNSPSPQSPQSKDRQAVLVEALEEIAEGKGRYSEDRLKHAENTIEDIIAIAQQALSDVKGGQ